MQADLFETRAQIIPSIKGQKLAFLERYKVSVRLDQIMVGGIILIVFYVLSFSFGVEKGKRFAFDELRAERTRHEQVVSELREKLRENMFGAYKNRITNQAGNPGVSVEQQPPVSESAMVVPAVVNVMEQAKSEQIRKGKYTIQLVTYKTKPEADRLLKTLSQKGLEGFVVPSGPYLQVCVNAYENREEAKISLGKLKSQRIAPQDAYIRNLA
ncbi:MAG: SPOR domain-containing protein [Candidatus Omnitrophica bacterium]|nr:SPOR domain-containing protein [Candidatus Omnitrophota bacterium]MDD5670819.1 SPOR domain-containing protein [Candidatus Omnitrophota bacterium]